MPTAQLELERIDAARAMFISIVTLSTFLQGLLEGGGGGVCMYTFENQLNTRNRKPGTDAR